MQKQKQNFTKKYTGRPKLMDIQAMVLVRSSDIIKISITFKSIYKFNNSIIIPMG